MAGCRIHITHSGTLNTPKKVHRTIFKETDIYDNIWEISTA